MSLAVLQQSSDSDQHQGTVSSVSTLDDGSVISGGNDGTLKIWSPDLNLITQISTDSGGVLSIAVSPSKIYTATSDQTIKAWTIPDLQFIETLNIDNCQAPQRLFYEKIEGGLWIGDLEGRVTRVIVGGDQQVAQFDLTEEIWDLCVTSNPLQVYTGRDRDVAIVEIVKGELRSSPVVRGTIRGRYPVLPTEEMLCCLDRTGRIIQVHDNSAQSRFKLLREITAGIMILNALCRGEGKTVYSGGYDGTVSLWDITTGNEVASVSVGSCVNALTTARSGAYAALDNGKIVRVGLQ